MFAVAPRSLPGQNGGMTRFALLALLPLPVLADAPVVEAAWLADGAVHVTLSHPDSGWDHYADGWEVIDAAGTRLGFRALLHPHVEEQPFTRSLRPARPLPEGPLFVRARCSVDGWNGAIVPLRRD